MFERKWNHPGEPTRRDPAIEIDFHGVEGCEGRLDLRRLKIRARNPQTQLTVEPILRPARQDADTSGDILLALIRCTRSIVHSFSVHLDLLRAESTANMCAGLGRL